MWAGLFNREAELPAGNALAPVAQNAGGASGVSSPPGLYVRYVPNSPYFLDEIEGTTIHVKDCKIECGWVESRDVDCEFGTTQSGLANETWDETGVGFFRGWLICAGLSLLFWYFVALAIWRWHG